MNECRFAKGGTQVDLAAGEKHRRAGSDGPPARRKVSSPDDRLMRTLVMERYMMWRRQAGFDAGPVSSRVFDLIAEGVDRERAVQVVHDEFDGRTAGCNPAHRALPLAMAGFLHDGD